MNELEKSEQVSAFLNGKPNKTVKKKRYIGTYIALIVAILLVAFPLYIAVITSLMTKTEANNAQFHWWPQQGFSFRGYIDAFTVDYGGTNVFKGIWNTLWMYIPPIIVGLYFSAMSAFAFAKMKFPFRGAMFAVLMTAIMIPSNMSTIAKVLIYRTLIKC